jgi:DNA-binding XRE family transcriptional regulator
MAQKQLEDWKHRWRTETKCSVRELAKLCQGWDPDSDVLPDPAAYNATVEKILRAVRNTDLLPTDARVQMTREEFFYGDGPLFWMRDAAMWAAKRFPSFPYGEAAPDALVTPNLESIGELRKTAFANRINELRKEHGWSVEQLAEKVGQEKSTVQAHISAESLPHPRNQKKYADAFGVRVSDLNRSSATDSMENTTKTPPKRHRQTD